MIRLIESGLFGHRLFPVDTEMMINRYNDCLSQIGIAPTKLEHFHIDGWGWSPEISDEKEDRYYLSHGLANPYGIILTPEQKDCPLYMPYHTFDWNIHKQIFENYEAQISDITVDNGIWIELDQNINQYRSPEDLLMMDLVHVKFNLTGDVQEASIVQKKYIDQFLNEPNAWLDSELRSKIIHSAKLFGDLRYRSVEIPDFHRGNLNTYFTVAFGGAYVFKQMRGTKPLIILRNNGSEKSGEQGFEHLEYNLEDHGFISYFFGHKVEIDQKFLQKHRFLIEDQMDIMIIQALADAGEDIDFSNMNASQKKGLTIRLSKAEVLPDLYFDMESVLNSLNGNGTFKVPPSLNLHLLHPLDSCEREEKIVLWQLLCNVQNNNPVLKYAFDKGTFFSEYQSWPEGLKVWAIDKILNNRDVFHRLID